MLGDEEHLEPPERHRENASRTGTCPVQDVWSLLSPTLTLSALPGKWSTLSLTSLQTLWVTCSIRSLNSHSTDEEM